MTSLTVEALAVSYGTTVALREVSFTIPGGTALGLIGPTGAGKSTLIKAAAGLLPKQGSVHYGDLEVGVLSMRELAALRAYVPQQSEAALPYTVAEAVAMGLAHQSRFYGTPAEPTRVARALADVGFERPATARWDHLSGGEQQQVLLARALVASPNVLILDEPVSALDLKHRTQLVKTLKQRVAQGATLLVSLHDLALAALLCERVLLLAHGRQLAWGTPHEVLTPEILGAAYGVPVVCGTHPTLYTPTVELDPRAWQ